MNLFTATVALGTTGLLLLLFVIKNVSQFKKSTGRKRIPFTFFLYLLAYITLFPGGILTLLIFALYRELVALILKVKYGSKFGGMLEGADAVHTVEGSKSVINILMIVQYDDKRYSQSPYETARQAIYNFYFRDPKRFPKFLSSFRKFMGYSFMLRNEVTVDDCVKKMKSMGSRNEKLHREDLLRLVTDCSNSPLPKNDTVLWEILVGTEPVCWNEDDHGQKNCYPVMFRVHHGIADGVSLLKLMVGAFADNPSIKVVSPEVWKTQIFPEELKTFAKDDSCKHAFSNEKLLHLYRQMEKILDFLLTTVYVLFLAPTTFFVQSFLKANDCNELHGALLSGRTILTLDIEPSRTYVGRIKKIKDRIAGTAFSEVLLTAFSASLEEYFIKNSFTCPRNISAVIPVLAGSSELKELTPGKYNIDINLKNKYSLLLLNLPLHVNVKNNFEENTSLIKRLQLLQQETSALKKSIDYVVNYWTLSVAVGLLPHVLVKIIINLAHCTTAISVVPGPPKVTFCGGSPVQDVVFWVPHMGPIGVTFSALTYDGRLQVGLKVDKALVSDEEAARSIVNGVYKYIDAMEKEISDQPS